jgi:GT2 family glycosyltransferase/ADP-heptose:LPS heptosyltransferase
MDSPAKIGVVTVLFNSEPVLPEFLSSITAQTHRNFTLFAVDNASTDSSLAISRKHGATCIANTENRGVAAANNQGITAALAAGCDFILLLNNDVRFGPELFSQLLAGIHTHQCEMTTPLMYFYDAPETIWCAGGGFVHWLAERPLHYAEGERDTGQFTQPRQVEFTPTCCVLIHRDVFERVGMMDERYFIYWDDTDFMLRAARRGVKLYFFPQAKLWHKVGALTGPQSEFTLRYATRNHAYYLRKHLPSLLAAFWSAIYLSVFAIGAIASPRMRIKLRAWLEGNRMPLDPVEPSIVFGVFSGMGDLLWAAPVIQAELDRGVSVHLLLFPGRALREFCDLLDLSPYRDHLHLHTLPADRKDWPRFLAEMRALSPKTVWISPHAPVVAASRKIPILLRALQLLFWRRARLAGAESEPSAQFLHRRLPVDRNLPLKRREWAAYRLLRPSLPEQPPVPRFDPTITALRRTAPRYDLVIHPGAGAKNRIWPFENYPALLHFLPADWKIAVLGLPGDVAALRKILPSGRAIDYITGSLRESLTTLASARALLAMDSGNMHFADVLGIPTVAIFLKDDPATVIGRHSRIEPVFRPRFPCQPCGRRLCNQPAIYCVDTVDPVLVAQKIKAQWARSPA